LFVSSAPNKIRLCSIYPTVIRWCISSYIIDLVLSAEGRPFHPSVPSSVPFLDDGTGGGRRLMAAWSHSAACPHTKLGQRDFRKIYPNVGRRDCF
jgi:hypothetical protein